MTRTRTLTRILTWHLAAIAAVCWPAGCGPSPRQAPAGASPRPPARAAGADQDDSPRRPATVPRNIEMH